MTQFYILAISLFRSLLFDVMRGIMQARRCTIDRDPFRYLVVAFTRLMMRKD